MKKNSLLFLLLFSSLIVNAQWENTSEPKADKVKNAGNCISLSVFQNSLIAGFPYSGVFVSNLDSSWEEANQQINTLQIVRLFNDGINVYATTKQGLYVNKNIFSNQNWDNITYNLPSLNTSINSIAIIGNYKIAGTDNSGVFINKNDSNAWEPSRKGLLDNNIKNAFTEADTFFVLTANDGLYFSADTGKQWKKYGQVACLQCLDVLKKNKHTWIVENQLVKHYEYGILKNQKTINGAKGLRWNNDTLFVFSDKSNQLFFSKDYTQFDSISISFAPDVYVNDLAFVQNHIYLATTKYGILKYNFSDWKSFNENLRVAYCNQIFSLNNFLFIKAYREIFRYKNGVWESSYHQTTGMNEVNEFCIDGNEILAATETNGVMKSTDFGETWQKFGTIDNPVSHIHISNKNHILAFSKNKAYQYDKTNNIWQFYFNMAPEIMVNCVYEYGDTILSGTGNGLYISYNNGSSFTKIPGIKSNPVNYIFKNSNAIWAKTGGELYITNDIVNFTSWYIYFYDWYPNFPLSDYHSFTSKGEFVHSTSGILFRPTDESSWNFQTPVDKRTIHQFALLNDTLFAATTSSVLYLPANKITTSVFKTQDKISFKIYPNPAQEFIEIETNKDIKSLLFYDVSGKRIMGIPDVSIHPKINISGLPKGIYFIKFLDKNNWEIGSQKLVKE